MRKNCTLCGNIYYNQTFKGGYVCEDCIKEIKGIDETKDIQKIEENDSL